MDKGWFWNKRCEIDINYTNKRSETEMENKILNCAYIHEYFSIQPWAKLEAEK